MGTSCPSELVFRVGFCRPSTGMGSARGVALAGYSCPGARLALTEPITVRRMPDGLPCQPLSPSWTNSVPTTHHGVGPHDPLPVPQPCRASRMNPRGNAVPANPTRPEPAASVPTAQPAPGRGECWLPVRSSFEGAPSVAVRRQTVGPAGGEGIVCPARLGGLAVRSDAAGARATRAAGPGEPVRWGRAGIRAPKSPNG